MNNSQALCNKLNAEINQYRENIARLKRYTIDSDTIAEKLELDSKDLRRLTDKYIESFEHYGAILKTKSSNNFEVLNPEIPRSGGTQKTSVLNQGLSKGFGNSKRILNPETTGAVGRPKTLYHYNYNQFCLLITLVRNNPQTVAAKMELIDRYDEAREAIYYLTERLIDSEKQALVAAMDTARENYETQSKIEQLISAYKNDELDEEEFLEEMGSIGEDNDIMDEYFLNNITQREAVHTLIKRYQ